MLLLDLGFRVLGDFPLINGHGRLLISLIFAIARIAGCRASGDTGRRNFAWSFKGTVGARMSINVV